MFYLQITVRLYGALCKQHLGADTEKFFLNKITTHKMASLRNIVTNFGIIVFRLFSCFVIKTTFWSSHGENCAQPHCGRRDCQFSKHYHMPLFYRFPLVCCCASCKQHFGALTVKFLVNEILTHKVATLKNTVTSRQNHRSLLDLGCLPSERN